jgi:arsenate reductase
VLELLQQQGFDMKGLTSKSWNEFAAPGAPDIDFIFTVCENCPV